MKAREQWTVTAGGGRNQWTVTAASRCVGAALLFSGTRAVCTAGTGSTDVAALAVAELSTTEACAVRAIRLLCRGLFSCVAMVQVRISVAWVQLCWLSGARAVCTAGTRFADVAAQAIDCRVN